MEISIDIELATTEAERTIGLMHRRQLPENKGMLFIFPQAGNHAFWNKNVNFPLSLGFFDDQNKLVAIKDMEAQSPISVSANNNRIKFVLEANQGFFSKNNINLGSTFVDIKRIIQKEEKRGLSEKIDFKDSYNFNHVVVLGV